jgi:peroxisomal enoyl-CoA hydratase 2
MPVSLEKALGHKSELPLAWNQRDMILYAAGVGAKADELQHLYELSPDWHPLPSFCLVLPFRGDNLSVVNYSEMQQDSPNVHMPPIVATAVVHASQSFQILKDLPLHGALSGSVHSCR